jgi:putative oxygen-independent coproporphyrinogen III oxidase
MIPIYPESAIQTQAPLEGSPTLSGLKNPPPLSLYIHIPWCVRKCPYCDFNSHESKADIPEKAYVDTLIADLEQATPLVWGRKIKSIFFGGGTPSLFSAESIDTILSHVRMLTPLEYGAEITLEANPGTIDTAHFLGYKHAGVNRVSVGIQSFNPNHLSALGRIHNREQAIAAAEMAIQTFEQVNLDIMYGLPQQTLAQALQDARLACQLKPAHLSFYHLTLEPNTPFYRTPPALPDDDESAQMQDDIEAVLAQNSYNNYETSAFSLVGKQCKHNLNYWGFGDYLGIGAGAHSKLSFHDKIIRQARHKHPKRYMDTISSQAFIDTEWTINKKDLVFEFMMNALRLSQGFDKSVFESRTGLPWVVVSKKIQQAVKQGLLTETVQHITPTPLGKRFLNNLLSLFLD